MSIPLLSLLGSYITINKLHYQSYGGGRTTSQPVNPPRLIYLRWIYRLGEDARTITIGATTSKKAQETKPQSS